MRSLGMLERWRNGTARRRMVIGMVVASVVVAADGPGTFASFSATSAAGGNKVESGSVALQDNDADGAMLSLNAALPGASDTGCIKVTYAGTLPSEVRLYGTTTGTGLDQYLDLKVTRGRYDPSQPEPNFDGCGTFQADSTNYINKGAGVVYDGTLRNYGDGWASGLVDPSTWAANEVHVYRIQVTLQNDVAAQGLNAGQTFTWEGRNN